MSVWRLPELKDGDTWVYDFDNHCFVCAQWGVMHWFYGLRRFECSTITYLSSKHYDGECDMSTGKAKTNNRKEFQFIGFVNITLTDTELALVDEEMGQKKPPDLGGQLDYLMDIGKVTFSYVRGSVNVTLTVLEGVSAGYAVSAFSDNVLEACLMLRLKVVNYLANFEAIYTSGGQHKKRG